MKAQEEAGRFPEKHSSCPSAGKVFHNPSEKAEMKEGKDEETQPPVADVVVATRQQMQQVHACVRLRFTRHRRRLPDAACVS